MDKMLIIQLIGLLRNVVSMAATLGMDADTIRAELDKAIAEKQNHPSETLPDVDG